MNSPVALFQELVQAGPPADAAVRFETVCVLGGSIAGLLAARVLSDRARRVVIIEPDDLPVDPGPRTGVPQDRQVHTLLPAGHQWLERWVPGITKDAQERGASLVGPDQALTAVNGVPLAADGEDHHLLAIGRPLLETLIRQHITSIPNVSVLKARASGLQYRDDEVSAVHYVPTTRADGDEQVVQADFVVDAMGRSSRLSKWLGDAGYDRPRLERLEAPINYASARFDRQETTAELKVSGVLELFTPDYPSGGVSVAAANAIEGQQWLVMLMGYGDNRPGRTMEEFRSACARLPSIFEEVTAGAVRSDVVTYHQAESRRRHFSALSRFPARLVSVGDAVASFNPVYGQGMSSAALHASCLAAYLGSDADLDQAAHTFFDLQQVVVDAAWAISAGGDTARLDAENGAQVPEDIRHQRWAMNQIAAATVLDADVARAFNHVTFMLRHPATLADPDLLARAVTVNEAARVSR